LLTSSGLGLEASPKLVADISAALSASDSEGQKRQNTDYFTATAFQPGHQRLLAYLQESCFFSSRNFATCAKWAQIVFWAVSGLIICMLVVAGLLEQRNVAFNVSQVLVVLLTGVVALDLWGLYRGYSEAARLEAQLDERIEGLLLTVTQAPNTAINTLDMLMLIEDHNAAVQGAPLIFDGVYMSSLQKLNQEWNARVAHRNKAAGSGPASPVA